MPNWCSTDITFYSSNENKEQLKKLYNNIKQIINSPSEIKNGFGNSWLGNIIHKHGLDWEKIDCRGSIGFLDEFNGNYFRIQQEDAWGPNIDMWKDIINKEYTDIELVYAAEEPGCELYINSDVDSIFYDEFYKIDGYLPKVESFTNTDDYISEYLRDAGEVQGLIEEIVGQEFNHWEQAVQYLKEICEEKSTDDEDYYFNVYNFDDGRG